MGPVAAMLDQCIEKAITMINQMQDVAIKQGPAVLTSQVCTKSEHNGASQTFTSFTNELSEMIRNLAELQRIRADVQDIPWQRAEQ